MNKVVLDNSQHFSELGENEYFLLLLGKLPDQLIEDIHFAGGYFELFEVLLGTMNVPKQVLPQILDEIGMIAALSELHFQVVHYGDILEPKSLLKSSLVFLINGLVDHLLEIGHFNVQNSLLKGRNASLNVLLHSSEEEGL